MSIYERSGARIYEHNGIRYGRWPVGRYKYRLLRPYEAHTPLRPERTISTRYFALTLAGDLYVARYYAWDGPSGFSIDTESFMRGTIHHDSLYQAMRMGLLDYRIWREPADRELQRICLEDGMWPARATWVYWAVRTFAEKHARPS